MADQVTLTIDDMPVTVPAGTLVVDAARKLGVEIPVFCSHPRLDPVGVCRMCMVEYVTPKGSRVDISCTVPVTEGMVVRTMTPTVAEVREAVLGFLLINHPLDCPICDKGGECPLQDQTLQYGPGASQFIEEKVHKAKHYPVSETIMLDQERCVLCWRCIRYLDEWEDKPQLGLFKRGDRTVIDHFPGQPVDSHTSGSVIDICPVGALTDRSARFAFRPWELKMTPSVCTLCPVGCSVRVDERVHQVRRIVAHENPAVNDMWICDKGRFVHDYADHPDRLQEPMVRDESGALRPATWEEALGRIVDRMSALIDKNGAKSVGAIAGGRTSNEAAYLLQKFFRTLVGNNNLDFATGSAVRALPTGLPALSEVVKADVIVLAGFDPNESAPILNLYIKRAVKRNKAKLVVIGPRKVDAVRKSTTYLPARPGAEAALFNGLASAILARRDQAAGRRGPAQAQAGARGAAPAPAATQGVSDEWAWVRGYSPERVQSATGVPPADLAAAAEALAGAKAPLFLYGPEIATGERGRGTVAALLNLAGLLGQADRVGYVPREANATGLRDMGMLPNALPGHQALGDGAVAERLARLWGVQPPSEPGLSYRQMLEGGVRGLWVVGSNPARDPGVAEAMRQMDFVVVQELFLTETAQLADVVLPAASSVESDATYTNLERRVQKTNRAVRAMGDSKPDWEIITLAAQSWMAAHNVTGAAETGSEPDWKRKKRREPKKGLQTKPWNYPSPALITEEAGRVAPLYADFRWENLTPHGAQWPLTALPRTRRIEPVTPAEIPPAAEGTLWLATGPALWAGGAVMEHSHRQVQKLVPAPFVALNPADATALGLPGEGKVRVRSERGEVELSLQCDPQVLPGTAWIPLGLAGVPAERLGAERGEPVSVTVQSVAARVE